MHCYGVLSLVYQPHYSACTQSVSPKLFDSYEGAIEQALVIMNKNHTEIVQKLEKGKEFSINDTPFRKFEFLKSKLATQHSIHFAIFQFDLPVISKNEASE